MIILFIAVVSIVFIALVVLFDAAMDIISQERRERRTGCYRYHRR